MNPHLLCDQTVCHNVCFPQEGSVENTVHPEWSGMHVKCPIQGNLICQCCVRMWAAIPNAKDIDFSWARWYGNCPRSFIYISCVSYFGSGGDKGIRWVFLR